MRLLVVEDEVKLGNAIKSGLAQDGYAVDLVYTAEDGQIYAEAEEYNAIVLDRMLPGGQDGLKICQALREKGITTPVLMLTARGEITDKIEGLDYGADDYLVKPFVFDELLARIRALLRRPSNSIGPVIQIGNLGINTVTKTVFKNGQPVTLSRREYALLEFLVHNHGHTVSKEQIIAGVWDFDADILPNTVEVFIRSLRKKLGKDIIQTVRGFGYKVRGNDV